MAQVVLCYNIPGNVTVDTETGEILEAEADIYNPYRVQDGYAEYRYIDYDNPNSKPTAEEIEAAEKIVEDADLDWTLG
jgi:hypothetical protein